MRLPLLSNRARSFPYVGFPVRCCFAVSHLVMATPPTDRCCPVHIYVVFVFRTGADFLPWVGTSSDVRQGYGDGPTRRSGALLDEAYGFMALRKRCKMTSQDGG